MSPISSTPPHASNDASDFGDDPRWRAVARALEQGAPAALAETDAGTAALVDALHVRATLADATDAPVDVARALAAVRAWRSAGAGAADPVPFGACLAATAFPMWLVAQALGLG